MSRVSAAKKAPAKGAAKTDKPAKAASPAAAKAAPAAPRPAPQAPAMTRAPLVFAGVSEHDLLKASPDEYMSPRQLAFFRGMLLDMQREIHEKADQTSEHLREHEIEPDPADQATIEEEYALELRARDRERKLLKKIEQSLRAIDDGSYGWCEETGEPIGIPRLLARPTATLSIEAQSRREAKQKLYGD